MRPFESITSVITPLRKADVDTDQIVPKQFLKLLQKSGYARYLFYDWRFEGDGTPRDGFVLNDPRYRDSRILVTGRNFGCGSSREHAVWALVDYGFGVIIAPSFADIFYGNCFKNGILPVRLEEAETDSLMSGTGPVTVNLESQEISTAGRTMPFSIEPYRKRILLEGLDEISQTLMHEAEIADFEEKSTVPSLV